MNSTFVDEYEGDSYTKAGLCSKFAAQAKANSPKHYFTGL